MSPELLQWVNWLSGSVIVIESLVAAILAFRALRRVRPPSRLPMGLSGVVFLASGGVFLALLMGWVPLLSAQGLLLIRPLFVLLLAAPSFVMLAMECH